jgi:type VI secretion system protein ImpL
MDAALNLLQDLASNLTLTLAVIVVLVILISIGVFLLARKALLGTGAKPAGGARRWARGVSQDVRTRNDTVDLRHSFRDAKRFLRRGLSGRSPLYRLPWYLLLGQARSGKTTLLGRSGLTLPFGEPRDPSGARSDCNWWYFHQGIVLDLSGELVLRRDGRTSDGEAWEAVLRQLQTSRPERPSDGIVLTIPASEVYDLEDGGSDLLTEAAHRAEILYRRLWEAQTALSMQLPVYVVVTQCDLLPGFRAFSSLLPKGTGGQMFGWSSPDSPETSYTGAWPDRIFDELGGNVNEVMVEVLGGTRGVDTKEAEQAFVLARSLRTVKEPLRIYLNQIFSPSSYHEAFFLRGLYFSGGRFDNEEEAASLPWDAMAAPAPTVSGAAGEEHPTAVLFGHDVLADKVFPEVPVGRPTRQEIQARKRTRVALGLASVFLVVLGAAGLPREHQRLEAEAGNLVPLLDDVHDGLARGTGRSDAFAKASFTALDPGDASVERLLAHAKRIERYRPWSPLMMSSWLSPLHGGVLRSVARGYDRLTMPSLRSELTEELETLARPEVSLTQGYDQAPTYYEKTQEFQQLQGFLQDMKPVEARVGSYNCVAETCKRDGTALLADLNGLLRHVYGEVLAPPTGGATRFYEKVARRLDAPGIPYPPAGTDYGLQAQDTTLSRRFHTRSFEYNAIMMDLRALQIEIDRLAAEAASITSLESYRQLLELIDQTAKDLKQPEVAWMGQPNFNLGSPYTDVLAATEASSFLGPRTKSAMLADGQARFRQMKANLATFSTPYTGPFLATEGGLPVLKLSDGLTELQNALQGLLDQSFLEPELNRQIVEKAPKGTVLTWNAAMLQQAQGLVTPYQEFLDKGLALFPRQLQGQVTGVATVNLEANMIDSVAQAQQFPPQGDLNVPSALDWAVSTQVKNFEANSPALSTLLTTFSNLRFARGYGDLAGAVETQQAEMLWQIDQLLEMQNLYLPQDQEFEDWNGKPTLAFVAFNVESTDELTDYLTSQRTIVSNLATSYASPLLTTAIRTSSRVSPLTTKWRTILADLNAYTNKMAGNPVLSLETFIGKTMAEVALPSCSSQVPARDPRGSSLDWFLARQALLRRGLSERCRELTSVRGRAEYRQLAEYFNSRLAGRFPFSEERMPELSEATPEAVAGFYELFDANKGVIDSVPEDSPAFAGMERQVREFMRRMERARALFAPALDDPDKFPVPTLDFQVDFRVNRQGESPAANEIIQWGLTIGGQPETLQTIQTTAGSTPTGGTAPPPPAGTEQTIQQGTRLPLGRWTYGNTATLTLRWAADSPMVPVADTSVAAVDGRTVRLVYRDLWSLLRLVRENPAVSSDFRGTGENRPQTLKLAIPVRPAGAAADEPASATTNVFVRITLLDPVDEKTQKQIVLPELPARAPELGEREEETAGSAPIAAGGPRTWPRWGTPGRAQSGPPATPSLR